jgi:imidazolonepropionase-like amidohydrolase
MKPPILNRIIPIVGALFILTAYSSPAPEGTLVITNANVITGDGQDVLEDQAVIINGGKISSIQTMDTVNIPQGTEIIDAQNAYLVPGFIDTHVHVGVGPVDLNMEGDVPTLYAAPSDNIADQTLATLLKYGVTTARDPGGLTDITVGAKHRVETGEVSGPRLYVAGSIIDTTPFENLVATVKTPEDVRAEVAQQVAAGVDWIKLYTGLSKDMVAAGIDEAHARGVKATGHLESTNWKDASELGIDSIVHIIPGSTELLPKDKRVEYEASKVMTTSILKWFELADFNSVEITDMLAAMRKNNVSLDPTLVLFHAMAFGDQDTYVANPALEQVAPALAANWRAFFTFNIGWAVEDFKYAQSVWPRVAEFVKLLHDFGILLTVGTDANNPWVVPGDSFHRELELLTEAGISERDVITMATKNGADLLGILDTVGTISSQKQADLVLLKANPFLDITATRKIVWVMQNGEIQ